MEIGIFVTDAHRQRSDECDAGRAALGTLTETRAAAGSHISATWPYHVGLPMARTHDDSPSVSDGTSDLLERARAGDSDALNTLFERHLPTLRRWTSGRLPSWARDIADTTDLVQETVIQTLKHLERFECRGEGALQAYLRQAVMNRVRNEIRNRATRGPQVTLDSQLHDAGVSPIEAAIAGQMLEQYENGLDRLRAEEREAVIARVEFGMSYAEIAETLGKPSANAARMVVVRALVRLSEAMKRA
jgi:RNA polymerase sigma-70 factor (ECF subfamily)